MTTASSPPPWSRDSDVSWAERYESLRHVALRLGAPRLNDARGLVLFLRQGTASWMEQSVGSKVPTATPLPTPPHGVASHRERSEVTQLLAAMVNAAAKVRE